MTLITIFLKDKGTRKIIRHPFIDNVFEDPDEMSEIVIEIEQW